MPALVVLFFRIQRHYRHLAEQLSLEHFEPRPPGMRHRVILPVSGVRRDSEGLRYARLLSSDVTAVHVSIDPETAERLAMRWETWGEGVRLVILDSPYRLMLEPLLDYIERILAQSQPNETVTIVVPQFVPSTFNRAEPLTYSDGGVAPPRPVLQTRRRRYRRSVSVESRIIWTPKRLSLPRRHRLCRSRCRYPARPVRRTQERPGIRRAVSRKMRVVASTSPISFGCADHIAPRRPRREVRPSKCRSPTHRCRPDRPTGRRRPAP